MTAELKNSVTLVSTIREKFYKPYDGAPKLGINENNAIVLDGSSLFLPVSPLLISRESMPLWQRLSSALHSEGCLPVRTLTTWVDYLQKANAKGLSSALNPLSKHQ